MFNDDPGKNMDGEFKEAGGLASEGDGSLNRTEKVITRVRLTRVGSCVIGYYVDEEESM